jgi:hypothetical protein
VVRAGVGGITAALQAAESSKQVVLEGVKKESPGTEFRSVPISFTGSPSSISPGNLKIHGQINDLRHGSQVTSYGIDIFRTTITPI